MPVLPAEPDLYPDDLMECPGPRAGPERRWWCAHTRPRREKAAARGFRKQGLCFYLPQVAQSYKTPGGRTLRSVLPLFPGYLFLRGDSHERVEAMKDGHLANLLEVPDQDVLEHELRQIHRVLKSGCDVDPCPAHVVGSRVRVLCGPLTGLEGTVIRRGNRNRIVAQVRFLGRGAMIDLQDWDAEPVVD